MPTPSPEARVASRPFLDSPLPGSPRSGSPTGYLTATKAISAGKLEHVAEKFSNFYNEIELEKQQRRMADAARFQMLTDSIAKLEKSLEAEIKRRAESDKQIQVHFESELKGLQERTAIQLADLQAAFKTSVDGLSRTMQDLHTIIKEEREQRRSDIEHLAGSLVNKVNECVAALDEERISRMDAESKILKQIATDVFRVQEKIDTEKAAREAELATLRSEIHEVLGNRNLSDEKFQTLVLDEINNLKSAVQMEREERISEDDEIVQAVNDYTRALQDGLRIVNNS